MTLGNRMLYISLKERNYEKYYFVSNGHFKSLIRRKNNNVCCKKHSYKFHYFTCTLFIKNNLPNRSIQNRYPHLQSDFDSFAFLNRMSIG